MPSPLRRFFLLGSASNEHSPPASEVIGSDHWSLEVTISPLLFLLSQPVSSNSTSMGWDGIPHPSQALSLGNDPTFKTPKGIPHEEFLLCQWEHSRKSVTQAHQSKCSKQMLSTKRPEKSTTEAQFCRRKSSFLLCSHFWELILSSDFSFFPSVYAA